MTDLVQVSQEIIDKGSKSFAVAAKLFNKTTYHHAIMLYAWCRHCDDQIDGQILGHGQNSPSAEEQIRRLDQLRQQTQDAMLGKPCEEPVFQAFAQVFKACEIPERYPVELLDGFVMDIDRRTYDTLDDTLVYCYHVAGTVGGMMASIMGVRDDAILRRAVDLGLAFQLTNICRDVLQDSEDQRVYLPRDWLEEAGVTTTDLSVFSHHTRGLSAVCNRVLDEADRYYESAEYGIAHLPLRCAWAITAAHAVYRDIGRLIRRRGSHAWLHRASTSTNRKKWLVFAGLAQACSAVLIKRYRPAPARLQLWSAPRTP